MRARYVTHPDNLTTIGNWIASRLPHWDIKRDPWPSSNGDLIVRVFGLKPLFRFVIFDWTHMTINGRRHVNLTVMGFRLYDGLQRELKYGKYAKANQPSKGR